MGLQFGCSTAVSLLSLISLAFLIIAIITPPATTAFGLAEDDKIRYGILGYCSLNGTHCVTGSPSYKVSELTTLTDWKMDDNARDTLAKIFIVAPIAGFLTLLSFLFNLLCHIKAIGGSFVFNLITFFFTLLSFLSTAVTVIVVFMCFYPHVKWPAWLLVPAGALTLISIPLAFFAMRTNSAPDSDDYDDEDEANQSDLTDLSDGGLFKNNSESFKMDHFPEPTTKSIESFEKTSSNAIRVIADDSSSANDHFEKISAKDYSRNNNNLPLGGYEGYNLNSTASQHTGGYQMTTTASADGTPNLVSAQNYNKVGAVVTEAPNFQPQSAKLGYGSTPYPSATYGTPSANIAPPSAPGISSTGNDVNPRSGSSFSGRSVGKNSQLDVPQHPVSDHPGNLTDGALYNDYDDQIPDDNDSDFTSVSQRAANPNYYRGLQNNGPKLFPNQGRQQHPGYHQGRPLLPQQQQQQQRPQEDFYFDKPQDQTYYTGQQQYGNQNSRPHLNQNGTQSSSGYYSGSPSQQQGPQRPVRNTSDILLNANPDFSVGGPAYKKKTYGKPSPQGMGSYKPAYKKLNQNSGGGLPAASLTSDSPYSFR